MRAAHFFKQISVLILYCEYICIVCMNSTLSRTAHSWTSVPNSKLFQTVRNQGKMQIILRNL